MKGNGMSYTVVEEFIVLREVGAVHYSEIGSAVELSADEAAELLAAGKVAMQSEGEARDLAAREQLRAAEAQPFAQEESEAAARAAAERAAAEGVTVDPEKPRARSRET